MKAATAAVTVTRGGSDGVRGGVALQQAIRVETTIGIGRAAGDVFGYVTTPALWHTWHPATVSVQDVPSRPLTTGETMRELITVAGRRNEAVWTVVACDAPLRWEIATDTASGSAHIVYRIVATDRGCRFHRTLDYRSKGRFWRLLDGNLTRWILTRQSARALRNLRAVMEGKW